jgi:cystathionine beta-lyase/cystathionine gamma-synthase
MQKENLPLSEILMHLGEERAQYFNAVAPPVIQTSNFVFTSLADMRERFSDELENHVYSRGNNPTVDILRKKIAALENAEDCLVFGSGAGAVATAVLANVSAGDHIICVKAPYSWTNSLLTKLLPRFGITHTFVDGRNIEEIKNATLPNTKVLFLESPNTLFYDLQDLSACSAWAKAKNIVTIIDNSYCSPLYQKPIDFGIDIVVHSATKYLNGHSDVVAGVLCGKKAMIKRIFDNEFMTLGGLLAPHDAALLIRGLRTLPLRLKQSSETAEKLIDWLEKHPKVSKIHYPFHRDFPQLELAKKQMKGCGGLFTVEFKSESFEAMENFINRLRCFLMAVSWGGHESLIMPTIGFYNIKSRTNPIIPFTTVRFYIGLEEAEYLINDLEQALEVL